MASTGYSGDLNWTAFTPVDNTGSMYSVFKSGYRNIRFNIQPQRQLQLTATHAYNLPGLAFELFGDSSLWRGLLAYNGLVDPLTDIYPGLVIQVPSKSDIVAYVSRRNQTNNQSVTI